MILTDTQILDELNRGTIVIKPFDRKYLDTNSYDIHLGEWLALYAGEIPDRKKHNAIRYFKVPREGLILVPRKLYLGVTKECTETRRHVPFLEGRSSIGRLGLDIHATAGKGDVGFYNTWTLEISVRRPVRVNAGMLIGQLIYLEVLGVVEVPHFKTRDARYTKRTVKPVESMMWKNFR
jgi:dCTP deaminase